MNICSKMIICTAVSIAIAASATPLYAQYCITRPAEAVSWWPFDEGTGVIARDILSGYNGTHNLGPSPIIGLVDSALQFDGTDDYVRVPATPALNITGDVTVELWFKLNGSGQYQLLSKGGGWETSSIDMPSSYVIETNGGNVIAGFEADNGANFLISYPHPTDGEWHHVAYRRHSALNEIYLDGALVVADTATISPGSTAGNDLYFGALYNYNGNTRHLNGALDEVTIYDRALDPSEILAVYQAGSLGKCKTSFSDVTPAAIGIIRGSMGVAWGDYDNDGDQDVFSSGSDNRLFRNEGEGLFTDQTSSPLSYADGGDGVAWGDYDNDGDLDLYVSDSDDDNKLFRNNGDGSFSDVTTGVLDDPGQGRGIAWGDFDNDGYLDLYVVNGGVLSGSYPNKLFRNDGGGSFSDQTSSPIDDPGRGRGVAWGDYDNDGDLDLSVADYSDDSKLFRNDGGGSFSGVSGPFGVDDAQYGTAWGDYDNDGDLDLYMTSGSSAQFNYLYRNDEGSFTTITSSPIANLWQCYEPLWGDYDNDGDLDLYLPRVDGPNQLLRNDGGDVFTNVTAGSVGDPGISHGAAWADFDKDGDLDLYIANSGVYPTWEADKLLRNNLSNGNHWLHVDVKGVASNASGIGARIRIVAGGSSQIREISGGSGYLSQNSLTAEFGLGAAAVADTVEVRWPSGVIDREYNVSADQAITITESATFVRIAGVATSGLDKSTGVAWGDYDNDGDPDLYVSKYGEANRLFRNDAGVFTDATGAPLNDAGKGRGAAWGDYDNDGDPDLYVVNDNGANKLFRNDGGGVFTDATVDSIGDTGNGWMGVWADYDGDSYLDLYVVNDGENALLRNNADGTFTDVTTSPMDNSNSGRAAAWGDYDNDGDVDLYLVNDGQANALFRNDGGGVFVDVTSGAIADSGPGQAVNWVDYDDDGDLDLYVVNYGQANKFFINSGNGSFVDATEQLYDLVRDAGNGHGASWADYDHNGRIDLYIVNDAQSNKLIRQRDPQWDFEFTDVTVTPLNDAGEGEGVAWADYDLDGDLDLYFANYDGVNRLLRNELENDYHWIHVIPVGTVSNRSAVGARVRVRTGIYNQFRTIAGGCGYQSQNSFTAEFGVGTATFVDTVEVRWPSGLRDVLTAVTVDTVLTVVETPRYATIDSIEDVPQDQGGWVRIHFQRSTYDVISETINPITTYAIHRRVDDPALLVTLATRGQDVSEGRDAFRRAPGAIQAIAPAMGNGALTRLGDRYFRVVDGPEATAPPGVWEVLGTVPARQQDHYIYLAPTVADSTETLTYSVYFIAAHTTTPSIYFDSPPDSGYSVDNIAPAVPPAFAVAYNTGSGNTLSWDPVPDNDLQYYKVYRDTEMDFKPSSESLVDMTTETIWSDPEYDGWPVYYKVTAVDDSGNEGDPTGSGPASGAGEDAAVPTRFALYQNVPNPFNPTTVIRYDVPAGGGHVTLTVYDVAGRLVRTLVDETKSAGVKTVAWNGANNRGARVATGVYFYRLTAPGFEQTRKMVLIQ